MAKQSPALGGDGPDASEDLGGGVNPPKHKNADDYGRAVAAKQAGDESLFDKLSKDDKAALVAAGRAGDLATCRGLLTKQPQS